MRVADIAMPKILFIFQNLSNGGAERVSLNLMRSLKRYGYITKIVVIQETNYHENLNATEQQDAYFLRRKHAKTAVFDIVKICNNEKPDLIFSNMSHLNLLVAIVRKALNKNSILVARETCMLSKNNTNYRLPLFWDFLYRQFYGNVDHLVCQSNAMKKDLVQNYLVAEEKCSVIPNPIDNIEIKTLAGKVQTPGMLSNEKLGKNKENNSLNIIFVGHFRPQKNIPSLIKAMTLTKKSNVNLHLIGDGCMRDRLMELNDEFATQKVYFHGFKQNPYKYIKSADVLIIPSFYEGFSNVLLEAIFLGKCVITTPWEGIEELDEKIKKFCFVAKDFTPIGIARAIDIWASCHPIKVEPDVLTEFYAANVVQRYHLLFEDL